MATKNPVPPDVFQDLPDLRIITHRGNLTFVVTYKGTETITPQIEGGVALATFNADYRSLPSGLKMKTSSGSWVWATKADVDNYVSCRTKLMKTVLNSLVKSIKQRLKGNEADQRRVERQLSHVEAHLEDLSDRWKELRLLQSILPKTTTKDAPDGCSIL